jgi:hypothetical protein
VKTETGEKAQEDGVALIIKKAEAVRCTGYAMTAPVVINILEQRPQLPLKHTHGTIYIQ